MLVEERVEIKSSLVQVWGSYVSGCLLQTVFPPIYVELLTSNVTVSGSVTFGRWSGLDRAPSWRVKVKVEVTQSCLTLCDPMDYIVHGILQARILKWVAFPFSRISSQPRDRTQVSRIAGRLFTGWAFTHTSSASGQDEFTDEFSQILKEDIPIYQSRNFSENRRNHPYQFYEASITLISKPSQYYYRWKNVICQISKQKMIRPSSHQPLQPPWGDSGCRKTGYGP